MADEREVIYTADTRRLIKGVDGAVTVLNQLRDAAEKAGVELDAKLVKSLDKSDQALNNLRRGAEASARALTPAAKATRELQQAQNALISERYALYDIASTYTAIGAALAGVGAYGIYVGASFESAFTNVERTSDEAGAAIGELREELITLSTQIPLTFQQLTEIATLGQQLGVASGDVAQFTETVAQFSAATGVGIDETSQSFGALGNILNLTSDQYVNLGSAIALAGRKGVVTEKQVLSLTREIAQQATQAGFSAEQVVGLSAALGDLRLPPERSRGALTTYFGTLNLAVAEGGDKLRDFATIVGVTAGELDSMVRSGQGEEIFSRFITNLQSLDNVDTTAALDRLGLAQLRVSDVFVRLSENIQGYNDQQAYSALGFQQGTELARQYAMIVDDLNSQWQIFVNSLNALVEVISGGAIPGLAGLLSMVTGVIVAFREWLIDSPFAASLLRYAGIFVSIVGVLALVRGAIAVAGAGIRAFAVLNIISARTAGIAATSNFGLFASLLGVSQGAIAAASGMGTMARFALIARAAVTLLLTRLLPLLILTEVIGAVINRFDNAADGIENVGSAAGGAAPNMSALTDSMDGVTDSMDGAGDAAGSAAEKIRTLADYASDLSSVFNRAFEIRFGGTQGMDRITTGWLDIADATARTNEEIAEYQRKLNELTADRAITEYFLGVAEAYNDTLRAGKLRSDLADIDADLRKEQDGLTKAQEKNSKTLVGNSRAAIDNRSDILGLVGGYQEYISALASSGASQEELQRAVQQLQREFYEQGAALGYNQDQLAQYGASFSDFATIINGVPRNLTIAVDPNPGINALREFEAQALATSNSAGGALGGIGGDLGGALDGMTADMQAFFDQLNGSIIPGETAETKGFFDSLIDDIVLRFDQMVGLVDAIFRGDWSDALKRASDFFGTQFSNPVAQALQGLTQAGMNFGREFTRNIVNSVYDTYNAVVTPLNDMIRAFSALTGINLSLLPQGLQSAGRAFGSSGMRGFSGGGYTGSISARSEAGVVHGREYVIPEWGVDQRTRLPKLSYVQSLHTAKPSPSARGYRNGGYVASRGNGGPQIMVIDQGQFDALLRAQNVNVMIDRQAISSANSSANQTYADLGRGV